MVNVDLLARKRPAREGIENMRELIDCAHLIGDRAALDGFWDEHGYWFFRGMLDQEPLRIMQDELMGELKALGVVDPDSTEPQWNGRPLENFPATFHVLHERQVWQNFVADWRITAFFEQIFGEELFWLPMDYYRLLPPSKETGDRLFLAIHQDGMQSPGMSFATCWIALSRIDERAGGLVIADGQHRRGYIRRENGKAFFGVAPLPEDSWARADYRFGDVVIFSKTTPHYGLTNHSDRFRLSVDIRPVPRSTRLPHVGTVRRIDADSVEIAESGGATVRLQLTDETYIRAPDPGGYNPAAVTRGEAADALPPGSMVMATSDESGRALLFRSVME